jgi:2-furoyl-CoA dehydrogenase large subunit
MLDGQVRGGFAMAVGAAFYERLVYAEDGGCVTGSLLDYALPTDRLGDPGTGDLASGDHVVGDPARRQEVAEGNSMSARVCIANAVADALDVAEVSLPPTPERVLQMARCRGS